MPNFFMDEPQKTVAKRDAKKAFLIGRNHVVRGMKYMKKMAAEKDRQSVRDLSGQFRNEKGDSA